jgi:1-acyl-sn-glycerol-3-phosphate acyltransferase
MMLYRLMRELWRVALSAFFRRVQVHGRERVPARGPVLVVCNHSNAFVDPLLVLTSLRRPVTLTAKCTLRRNPLLGPLIRALGVVELHRSQDVAEGADPARNRDALDACARRLEEGGCVVMFPEGVSHSDPGLRPFRSGAARLALDYRARGEQGGGLVVVPVGLHFQAKERFRSAAGIVFGPPLALDEWLRLHPRGDAAELTDELEARIRALTVNHAAERELETFARAAELLEAAGQAPPPLGQESGMDFAARVALVHRLQAGRQALAPAREAELQALEGRLRAFGRKLQRLMVAPAELFLPLEAPRAAFFLFRELELLLAGFPLAAWGRLNHAPAYALTRLLVRRSSRDRDHFASNAIFMGIPVFLLCYALQVTAAFLLLPAAWAALYALSLPYSAAVALMYGDRAGGAWRRARTFLLLYRRPRWRAALVEEAQALIHEIQGFAAEAEGAVG